MPTRNLRKMHSKCLAFVSQCQWQQVAGKLDFQFYGSVCISTFKISSWWKCFLPFTCVSLCQSWGWDLKNIHDCPLFFKYFQQFKEKQWPSSSFNLLWGLTIAIITPIHQASTSGRVLAKSPTTSAPKKWKSDVHVWCSDKKVHELSYSATLNWLFMCRIVILRLLKLNIKARYDMLEFLTANILWIHVIALDIDWSKNIFSMHMFCSLFIKQLIDAEMWELRTESCQTLFPSFCLLPSEVAVLFDSNLS